MNYDTTDNSNSVTVSWTGEPPLDPINGLNITEPKRCKDFTCNRFASFGSDYCEWHGSNASGTDPDLTDLTQPSVNSSGPSKRDLQRQLDRLEGKLDAILSALTDGEQP